MLEDRKDFLQCGDLLVIDEEVGVLQLCLHLLGVGDEVGGDISAVKLHPFDHLYGSFDTLSLFDGDYTFLTHLAHSLGNKLTDLLIPVSGDLSYMLDLLEVITDLLCHRADLGDNLTYGLVYPTLEVHWIRTRCDILETNTDDALGKDCCSSRTIPSVIIGLGGNLLNQLRTHVLEGIL